MARRHRHRSYISLSLNNVAPYGVRAGAKKIGHAKDGMKTSSGPVPNLVEYEMEHVIQDLVTFAARFLRPGGRLVYWLPTVPDEYVQSLMCS